MSREDYFESGKIIRQHPEPSFAALIMAAYRKADSTNATLLHRAWPHIVEELQARYDARGGGLPGERT